MNLMHPHRVADLTDALLPFKIQRSSTDCDNAIQSAIEALTAEYGTRPDPDTTRGWDEIEPHALRFLDVEQDERGRIYEMESAL